MPMPHGKKADEACLEAERTYAEAWARLEEARDRFKEKYGREEPDAFSKALREGFAKQGLRSSPKPHAIATRLSIASSMRCTAQEVQTCRKLALGSMKNLTGKRLHTTRPSSPLDDANNDAYERFDNLFQTLVDTQPTTLSGLSALFACPRDNKMLREQIWAANDDYIYKFIATLGTATAKFAKT